MVKRKALTEKPVECYSECLVWNRQVDFEEPSIKKIVPRHDVILCVWNLLPKGQFRPFSLEFPKKKNNNKIGFASKIYARLCNFKLFRGFQKIFSNFFLLLILFYVPPNRSHITETHTCPHNHTQVHENSKYVCVCVSCTSVWV